MGHRHSRDELLDAAVEVALDDGLGRLTFGHLARRTGVSDRMLVYYFPTKDDLVSEVLVAIGGRLQAVLERAFTAPAADHRALAKAAWPVLARPDVDPLFVRYFEAIGLAVAGEEPYRTLAEQLVEAWVSWLAGFLEGPARQRRAEAEATVALIDGLLLVRQLAGSTAAGRAATRLGLR